jgi:hypothetical protein
VIHLLNSFLPTGSRGLVHLNILQKLVQQLIVQLVCRRTLWECCNFERVLVFFRLWV